MPWQDPPDKSLDKVWEGSCHNVPSVPHSSRALKNVKIRTVSEFHEIRRDS